MIKAAIFTPEACAFDLFKPDAILLYGDNDYRLVVPTSIT
jgi:hypothetical protein